MFLAMEDEYRDHRSIPSFKDLRLVPGACAAWVASWWATSGLLSLKAVIGIAVVLGLSALCLVVWKRREELALPRPRHRLFPAGSLRLSIALVSVVAAGAALLGIQARLSYDTDPFHEALASRHTLECDVEIIGYPRAHNRGSSLATKDMTFPARTVRLHLKDGRAVVSSVELRIRGKGMAAFQRGDHLRVRVKALPRQRLPPPVAGEVRVIRLIHRQPADGANSVPAAIRTHTQILLAEAPLAARGLIPGLAMGDRSALSQGLNEAMRVASLSHLSAISGMHIAVVMAAVVGLVPGRGALRLGTMLMALGIIVLLAGPTASVLRSVTMASVGAWGLAMRRSGQAVAALSAAVIVMLYGDPWNAHSYSFALSALATAGVVTHGRHWQEWGSAHLRSNTLPGRIARACHSVVVIPIAAQLWVMPVLILMEPEVPLWGVMANVAVSPVVAPLTILSLLICLSAPLWPQLAEGLLYWAEPLCTWVDTVARTVASMPGARMAWIDGADGALLWCLLCGIVACGIKVVGRVGNWTTTRASPSNTERGDHGAT